MCIETSLLSKHRFSDELRERASSRNLHESAALMRANALQDTSEPNNVKVKTHGVLARRSLAITSRQKMKIIALRKSQVAPLSRRMSEIRATRAIVSPGRVNSVPLRRALLNGAVRDSISRGILPAPESDAIYSPNLNNSIEVAGPPPRGAPTRVKSYR